MPKRNGGIALRPAVLKWARERADCDLDELAKRLKLQPQDILEWERSGRIGVNQVDDLARQTYTPVGYFYLARRAT